jgi:hypothetical protein
MKIFKKFLDWCRGGKDEPDQADLSFEVLEPISDLVDDNVVFYPEEMVEEFQKAIDSKRINRAVLDYFEHHGSNSKAELMAQQLANGGRVGCLKRDPNPNAEEPMASGITTIYKKLMENRDRLTISIEEMNEFMKQDEQIEVARQAAEANLAVENIVIPLNKKSEKKAKKLKPKKTAIKKNKKFKAKKNKKFKKTVQLMETAINSVQTKKNKNIGRK